MTLIELLAVVTIQTFVLGTVTALLCFTLDQIGQNSAGLASLSQASAVLDDIAATVRNSFSCSIITKNGIQALRCKMPANASDSDADGVNDIFAPDKFSSGGKPSYSSGQRIWYYLADSTGTFGSSGNTLWRAVRTDDSNPTSADVDKSWSQYYASGSRFPLINSLAFTVNSSSQVATVTLVASAAKNAPDRSGAALSGTDVQAVTFSETLPWRSDFE